MKVKNFAGFMKTRLNESASEEYATMGMYGANPEDDMEAAGDEAMDMEEPDMEEMDGEEEEVTLESLKAMVDELTERVEALEGGGEEEEAEEGEEEEGEEGEEEEAEEGEEEEV
jgi:hypothetical protein